jgi:hypothetical protein
MAYVPNSSSVSLAVFEIIKQKERTRRNCCNCFATLVSEKYGFVRNTSWQFAEKVRYIRSCVTIIFKASSPMQRH